MSTVYVARDMLTRAEVEWNVRRLKVQAQKHRRAGREQRASALEAHAHALAEWDRRRVVVPMRSAAGPTP